MIHSNPKRSKARKAARRAKAKMIGTKRLGIAKIRALIAGIQRELNAAVRLRDGAACISCLKAPLSRSDWNAGHLFGVGPFPALRFHPLNISSQCAGCNLWRSGNHAAYSAAFIRRHGLATFEALDAIKSEPRQWRVPDLLELRSALAQGLDAYTARYFELTSWKVVRPSGVIGCNIAGNFGAVQAPESPSPQNTGGSNG